MQVQEVAMTTRLAVACLAILLFLNLAMTQGRAAERTSLTTEESKISLVGDDTFVINRYKYKLYDRYSETITFRGGYLNFSEAYPGYELTGFNDLDRDIVKRFNNNKTIKNRGLSVTKSDVRYKKNTYSEYAYLIKGDEKGTCMLVMAFFGQGESVDSPGNKSIYSGICRNIPKGTQENLEAFMHDLMSRLRFDDGAINKAKAGNK
jgi:hypothetical protein